MKGCSLIILALSTIAILLSLPGHLSGQTIDPAREFLDGNRGSFSTKGHPKSKGVVFTIAYPKSWAAEEGERPNIVQKFVSEHGRGLEMVAIITKQLPLPSDVTLTDEDQRKLFDLEMLREMLPSGAMFVGAQSTEIEAIPAGILEYRMQMERAGMRGMIHVWTLNFVYDKTLVQVQFAVSGLAGSEEELSRHMIAFKPLFIFMANSIVFPEKWAAAPAMSRDVPVPSSYPYNRQYSDQMLSILVVSFIVTWCLGLSVPLILRYVLLRRPLGKMAASVIAAGFSLFLWIAFFVAHAKLGEKPGSGFVWIITFFIGRWILCRGYVPALSPKAVANAKSLTTASADGVTHRR